ncbi:MAG: hypothetical protein AABX11_04935 [Nanoarchaeota archaeon]
MQEIYSQAYALFKESYEIIKTANFMSFNELRMRTLTIIRTYAQIVPNDVRNSFELKPRDLTGFLADRRSAENIVATAMHRL